MDCNFLARHDLAVICGKSGYTKSFVALDMMLKLATGQTFAKRFKPVKPLNVVYLTKDNHTVKTYFDHLKPIKTKPNLAVIYKLPNLVGNLDDFIDSQSAYPPIDLLVINPLESAIGRYNPYQQVSELLDQLKHLSNRLNCAIALIHGYNDIGQINRLHYEADIVIECNNASHVTFYQPDLDITEYDITLAKHKLTWHKMGDSNK